MSENFANNYSTALDGAIDNSQTTFDVLSVGGAPSVNFRIKVENELMLVTGVSSLTFTVTRGVEGTSAASHDDGTLVTHVFTATGIRAGTGFIQSSVSEYTQGSELQTTSTSFVDMTGQSITITTEAVRCLVIFAASANNSNAGSLVCFDLNIDGTRHANTTNGLIEVANSNKTPVCFTVLTDVLSAGSHTFKIQWRVSANTGGIASQTSTCPITFQVIETTLTV